MNPSSHATQAELAELERLEAAVKSNDDRQLKLDLAQLLIEPAHRDDEAFKIYESILASDPWDAQAAVGAAYVHIHTFMAKENLLLAVSLLTQVLDRDGAAGRGEMLLAEALGDLGRLTDLERMQMLERSVERAPTWSKNHLLLALAYRDLGDRDRARIHITAAQANRLSSAAGLTLVEVSFEVCYTGRLGSAAFLEDMAATIS
jgi:tetratricopeptide (TPR) repeat protein